MEKRWNLITKAFVVALLAATSAFAIDKGSDKGSNKGSDLCPEVCEPAPGPFAFTYAKDLCLTCPTDFYVYGEYLLMQSQMEGLDYALQTNPATYGAALDFPINNGKIEGPAQNHHDWDYNSGFRAGFGYYMNHDTWSLEAKWTYLRMKEDSNSTTTSDSRFVPLWIPAESDAVGYQITNASARWKGTLNSLDIMLGKPFHASRYFILNPFAGVRAAWIDQHYVARYGGNIPGIGMEMLAENDFWGIGLRGGAEAEYIVGSGVELFGSLAASLLFGKFDVGQDYNDPCLGSVDLSYKLDQNFYTNIPNMELAFGLQWSTLFNKNRNHVALRIAYEFHEWWNMNQFWRWLDDEAAAGMTVSRGNLSFNGFSFRLQFDF